MTSPCPRLQISCISQWLPNSGPDLISDMLTHISNHLFRNLKGPSYSTSPKANLWLFPKNKLEVFSISAQMYKPETSTRGHYNYMTSKVLFYSKFVIYTTSSNHGPGISHLSGGVYEIKTTSIIILRHYSSFSLSFWVCIV